jgi:hypothetical protein
MAFSKPLSKLAPEAMPPIRLNGIASLGAIFSTPAVANPSG